MFARIAPVRWLLVLFALLAALPAATAEAKLYAIFVMATWDKLDFRGRFGEYAKNDKEAMMTALSEMSVPKDLTILPSPRDWNECLRTIENCPTGPEDAILIFFSGHGAYNEETGHILELSGVEDNRRKHFIERTKLRTTLANKKVRLTVLMSNSCFSHVDLPPPDKRPVIVGSPPPPEESSPLFQSLFLKARGIVDITACQKDRNAAPNYKVERSIFANAVARELDARADDALDWNQFFLAVRDSAAKEFQELFPDGHPSIPDQIALAFRLPGDTALDRAGPRFGVKGFGTNGNGVRVGEVFKGFPGELAGLQIGDVIVGINGRAIAYEQDYDKAIDASRQDMELTILRGGRKQTIQVRLRY